ncbi:MAG: MFS transporter [Bacteroidota bacterium]
MFAKNNPKVINAWCMYDWANSVYALTITSAIFPIYFNGVAKKPGTEDLVDFFGFELKNSVLYSYTLGTSFLVVALILPLLSGIADYSGKKKLFLKAFMYLGASACIGLYWFRGVSDVELAIILSFLASIGYSGGLVFYDAFLPEIATADRFDMVSAKGYSLGYIGGVILLIINLVVLMMPDLFFPVEEKIQAYVANDTLSYEAAKLKAKDYYDALASRIAFVTVGVWWILFSQITFKYLQKNINQQKPEGNILTEGYKEIIKVTKSLFHNRQMATYLLAFFFYNMGVQTVMYLATTFGTKELKLADQDLIGIVLVIQLVAIGGAYLFAYISKIKGNKYSLMTMIIVWIFICFGAYLVQNTMQFYSLAFVVGMVMGGIQSLSRATFSKLIPVGTIDTASYFSFYDVTFNLSIFFGTVTYGLLEQITSSMRSGSLALATFFFIGMSFLYFVRIPKDQG